MIPTGAFKNKTALSMGETTCKAWKFIYDRSFMFGRNLNRTAIVTGGREYTYVDMFRQWGRYAAVFSTLHMTGFDQARVGMLGSVAVETIFTFYGLNMVGAEVSILPSFIGLNIERFTQTIQNEKLTDLILMDDVIAPDLLEKLLQQQEHLGLHHVILVHIPFDDTTAGETISAAQEMKYLYLKNQCAPVCMDLLLDAYGNYPVSYDWTADNDQSVIIHTSGTTEGIGKPITLSDRALNSVAVIMTDKKSRTWIPQENQICAVTVDLSNAYSLLDQVHLPLAVGGTVAVAPGGALNPSYYKAIPELNINVLFGISAMFEHWMKLPSSAGFDFSSLRCVILGGSAVSAEDKLRYSRFLKAHGSREIPLINGYGISELGGACCLSTADLNDESIGYLLPGVSFRLFDEEKNTYLTINDAPCSGVLYLSSPAITGGRLDGKKIVKTEVIDNTPYVCTNDVVHVDAGGKLTYLGRANRYFINEQNKKYESGRVETELSRQEGMGNCCIVPVYVKSQHDNLPMLCATVVDFEQAEQTICRALRTVFVEKKSLKEDLLPYRVLIAEALPRNVNGKIDLYAIQQGHVAGNTYRIQAMKTAGRLQDFRLIPQEDDTPDMVNEVYEASLRGFQMQHMKKEDENTMNFIRDEIREDITADSIEQRMADGSINDQPIWKYVIERNSDQESKLHAVALIDCTREYTYEEMFREWERYARVFSALNITGDNHSRVGIAGSITAEPLFAFYACNITGATASMMSYPDFLPNGHWKTMVQKEKITDLVLSDIMVTPDLWREIEREKSESGLRNVILVHSLMGGPCTGPAELLFNEFHFHALERMQGTVFMGDLLKKYATAPIVFGTDKGEDLAIITHTSGTTKGTRKPLPYTNQAVNTVATNIRGQLQHFKQNGGNENDTQGRIALSYDYSSFFCMCGLTNSYLANTDTLVLTFFGFMHPKYVRAAAYYKLTMMFAGTFMMDAWMARKDTSDIDFSSLHVFACGGSYISPDKVKKYESFLKEHGYQHSLLREYGMSETGGARLTVPDGCDEDILGYPVPKEDFMIRDENDGKFYTVDDGVRVGTMYTASKSLCSNELDGEKLFDFTEINGRPFVCTNDMVRVNEDGSFSYAGRADKFFVNNDGVRFESGLVETWMSKRPEVKQCALVPVLEKRIHDTVPVLYVIPENKTEDSTELLRKAILEVFTGNEKLITSMLPTQLVLVDYIPCNTNGKIDVFRITRDRLKGDAYNIIPVREGDRLVNISLEKAEQVSSITGGTLPEHMDGNSALDLYMLFNKEPEFKLPKFFL